MNKVLFAAVSGVAFGLVLGVNGHIFYTHMGCHHRSAPSAESAETPPAPRCAATASLEVASASIANVHTSVSTNSVDVDTQADQNLAQAKKLANKDPQRAGQLCRDTMLLYNNNPKNERVRAAFKLLNSIKSSESSEDDDR